MRDGVAGPGGATPPRAEVRYRYRRPGKGVTVYRQQLVLDRPDVKVLLMEDYGHPDVCIDDTIVLERHAPSLWFVFPGAWSDVGRFHLADGTFTGWYTNVCSPLHIRDRTWSSTDLFLDLWVPVAGEAQWQDEAEFEAAVASGLLGPRLTANTRAERARIERLLADGSWPPRVSRDIDLAVFRPSGR